MVLPAYWMAIIIDEFYLILKLCLAHLLPVYKYGRGTVKNAFADLSDKLYLFYRFR